MRAVANNRKRLDGLTALLAAALASALSACSASTDSQSHLGINEPTSGTPMERTASAVVGTKVSQPLTNAAPAKSPVVAAAPAGAAGAAAAIGQRCEQLRQDGIIWERTRKLAVLNRGEAGARMADLNTPWTKENVSFYLTSCQDRKSRPPKPSQAHNRTTAGPG